MPARDKNTETQADDTTRDSAVESQTPGQIRTAAEPEEQGNTSFSSLLRAERAPETEGAGQVILDAQEKGYAGFKPDPTPNENYTIAGVTRGAPTPETNAKLNFIAQQRVTLPAEVPFMPSNQEQYEELMAYKNETMGAPTTPGGLLNEEQLNDDQTNKE